jgi:uncharacterized coiled-coil protein SlyX
MNSPLFESGHFERERPMKSIVTIVFAVFLATTLFPSATQAKDKKTTATPAKASAKAKKSVSKKIVACDPRDRDCLRNAGNAVDAGQDRDIADLNQQIKALRYAQRKAAKAKDLKSAVDRIAALEEARKALPPDLVGKSEIEILIRNAQTSTREEVDRAIETLNSAFDGRIGDLEVRVTELEKRVDKIDRYIDAVDEEVDDIGDTLERRAITFEVFGAGLASNGVLGGGAGAGLLLPLGQTGKSFFRGDVWLGAAEKGFAWGTQLSVDWWITPWFAIGPGVTYSSDNGKGAGIQSLTAGIGPDLRFQAKWFMASVMPFAGVVGFKPYGKEHFGGGANLFLGASF